MKKLTIFLGCLALLASGCALRGSSKSVSSSKPSDTEKFFNSENIEPEGNAALHYIDARLHKLLAQDQLAIDALRRAVAKDQDSPYLHAELARHLAEANKFEQAKLESNRSIELDPNNSENHLLKGKLFSVKRNSKKSLEEYQKCIELNPDEMDCYAMMAREYAVQKDMRRAKQILNRYLKRDPSSPEILFLLASLYVKEENLKKAIPLLEKVLEEDPKYYRALTALSQIYLSEKNYDKALEYLLSWEQLAPNDIITKLRVGLIYYEQENYPEAIQRFARILELEPQNDRVLYYLGILETQNKRYKRAEDFFKRVDQDSKFYKDAVVRLAVVLAEQEKYDEAIVQTKAALKIKKEVPELYDLLGNLYLQKEKNKKALKVYEKGLKKFPEQEKLLFSKGVLLDTMGRFEESMETMKTILRLNPDHAMALNYLGYSYADRNIHLQEALQMLLKANRLKPDDGYIIDSLAWAYYRLGQIDKSLELLNKANRLSPQEPTILEHLGDVYLKMGQRDRAKGYYQQAVAASVENPPQDERERKNLVRIREKLAKLKGNSISR